MKNLNSSFKRFCNVDLKKKFDNLLGGGENISIEDEKKGLEQYGFNDDDFEFNPWEKMVII